MKKGKKEKKNGKAKKANGHSTRLDCTIATLQQSGPITKEQWIKQADKLYAKQGGSSNPKESVWAVRHTYSVLMAFNLIEDKDGAIVLKK